ncbi:hypothetical protein CF327_g3609 [Tilletia walkeri]|nr:hypothetical protein CF327_g3609 [Tilletia walkeri]
MPSIRATVVSNIQQNRRTVAIFPSSPVPKAAIYKLAKQRLGVKQPYRIFNGNGRELTPRDGSDSVEVVNGMTILVSTNIDFIGASNLSEDANSSSTSTPQRTPAEMILITNETAIDDEARAQLRHSATLPGMRLVAGMPDLHAGAQRHPVGAAFISRGRIYPSLVGGDIGCGMLLLRTRLGAETNVDRLAVKMRGIGVPEGLEGEWTHGVEAWKRYTGCDGHLDILPELNDFDRTLGTIGGGNHFAELTKVEIVYDRTAFAQLGLDRDRLLLLVHSGSRGLGSAILEDTNSENGSLEDDSEAAQVYLRKHDGAIRWARSNRHLIAHRVLSLLGERGYEDGPETLVPDRTVLDVCHNRVDRLSLDEVTTLGLQNEQEGEGGDGQFWIHRKGAAPSTEGVVVIPGSRGALSYVVQPVGNGRSNALSLAHGAGRILSRHKAHTRMSSKYGDESKIASLLERTSLGGRVICEDRSLLFEEAPEAYKDEGQVVRDLEYVDAIRVICTLRPVVSYKKGSRSAS